MFSVQGGGFVVGGLFGELKCENVRVGGKRMPASLWLPVLPLHKVGLLRCNWLGWVERSAIWNGQRATGSTDVSSALSAQTYLRPPRFHTAELRRPQRRNSPRRFSAVFLSLAVQTLPNRPGGLGYKV